MFKFEKVQIPKNSLNTDAIKPEHPLKPQKPKQKTPPKNFKRSENMAFFAFLGRGPSRPARGRNTCSAPVGDKYDLHVKPNATMGAASTRVRAGAFHCCRV
jgi:hypothetical protein